ncbi:MAG: ECF transporter S component [Solobacterium sp.]|nr:ECF transporter S component [Solobacterium sp.]
MKQNNRIKTIARIAILGAIAYVLMLVEFPLPIAPSFYKFDFSEVPVLIGAFAMGPLQAIAIEALKIVLNLLFNGTITMGVGEFANFLIGIALSVPAGIVYQRNKSKKGAVLGMLWGSLCMAAAGVVLNYFVLIPAFVAIAHYPLDAILAMGAAIYPVITNTFMLVLLCVLPFNLIKAIAVSCITYFLYKRISPLLH